MVAGKAWIKIFGNSMNMKCEISDNRVIVIMMEAK